MLSQRNRTATLTTAPNNNQLKGTYQSCAPKASENHKEKIGELLLFLQNPLPLELELVCWSQFKTRLSQFYDLQEGGAE